MARAYDNWEKLVRATLRRDELWQLCHEHSRTPSGGSTTSGTSPGSSSPMREVLPEGSTARVSPLNHQNRQRGTGFKDDKSVRRRNSRMRLDRWILTRWFSNSFGSKLNGA